MSDLAKECRKLGERMRLAGLDPTKLTKGIRSMADKEETKVPRIKKATKITGKAESSRDMARELCEAREVPANGENMTAALDHLCRLGYGKIRATTKWARKPENKPAKKAPKKAAKKVKKDPAPAAA